MSATCVGKFWAVTSFVAAVASCVGFYFPYWLEGRYVTETGDVVPMYVGVFRRCTYPRGLPDGRVVIVEECGRYSTFLAIPSVAWQIGTIVTGTGSSLALLLSLAAIISLCVPNIVTVRLARTAGVLQLLAGVLVATGVSVYPYGLGNRETTQICGVTSRPYHLGDCNLYWAFYLAAMGGGLTILCSTLTCHAYRNKTDRHAPYPV
ncbi:LHFPL tetraspan subfamily member 6 protein [Aplysia californica]|uniref:LHFPL tetraspan subfamily member 6 protein n=1 Tax=Aplysia californica TaxID=6500 RepID=A0ABM1AFC8_APLCA|nr:LHFPL tetraspan subfamily member 6 protein [Aplysia californica]